MDLSEIYRLIGRVLPFAPLQEEFLQRAFLALLFLAPACAAVGVPVVNARMSFFSDAVGHSAFAGAALGVLGAFDARIAMSLFAVLVGIAVTAAVRRGRLPSDAAIAVLLSGAVAFGLAVLNRSSRTRATQYLFGDILALSDADILRAAAVFALVALFQVIAGNRVLYAGISPPLAQAHGVRVALWDYAFAVLLSLVAILAVQAAGALLATALIVVPAAAARPIARSLGGMFRWSVLFGTASALSGLLLSADPRIGTATGPLIVLCAIACFLLASLAGTLRGRDALSR